MVYHYCPTGFNGCQSQTQSLGSVTGSVCLPACRSLSDGVSRSLCIILYQFSRNHPDNEYEANLTREGDDKVVCNITN